MSIALAIDIGTSLSASLSTVTPKKLILLLIRHTRYKLLFSQGLYHAAEPFGAGSKCSLHTTLSVNMNQSKFWPPAISPFKIIKQAPVEITTQIHPLAYGSFHR